MPTPSKLYNKKKDWLTIADAARQLSFEFNEEVTEADLWFWAIEGTLLLSIYFKNIAYAIPEYHVHNDIDGEPTWPTFGNNLVKIHGVRDLCMTGKGKEIVEKLHSHLTGTMYLAMGAILSINDGICLTIPPYEDIYKEDEYTDMPTCYWLYERFDAKKCKADSEAKQRELDEHISIYNIEESEAERIRSQFKQERDKYLRDNILTGSDGFSKYCLADSFPEGSVLGVRISVLNELFERFGNKQLLISYVQKEKFQGKEVKDQEQIATEQKHDNSTRLNFDSSEKDPRGNGHFVQGESLCNSSENAVHILPHDSELMASTSSLGDLRGGLEQKPDLAADDGQVSDGQAEIAKSPLASFLGPGGEQKKTTDRPRETEKPLATINAIAKHMEVHPDTVKKWRKKHKDFPASAIGSSGRVMAFPSELNAWKRPSRKI